MEWIARIHLDWTRRVARDLAPYAISPKQIFLLRKLDQSDGLNPSEIATLLHGDRPSATSMLTTLEREGWITRQRDPSCAKRVRVALSPAGRAKLASVPPEVWRTGRTRLDPEACLAPGERVELARLLAKLHQGLTDPPTP